MNPDNSSPLLVFDFADKSGKCQRRIFREPVRMISANSVTEVESALNAIEKMVKQGYYAAGYISYEASPAFDPAYRVAPTHKIPLLWFGIFSNADRGVEKFEGHPFTIAPWESDTSQDTYIENIHEIKEAIARGDTYQVNYTMRLRSQFEGDDLAYYHILRNSQNTEYSTYLNIGRFRILSLSPELFFRLDGKTITTRPMKGTVQRGRWLEEDQELISWLSTSSKNQAENVMIVDLLRNDLSKIPGVLSVQVLRLFEIESYPTVHQMTSTVTATVQENTTFVDVLRALFPSGSITGAPKISTMGLISELEQHPREIYCGTIGFVEPNGEAVFNVAIRSILIDDETGIAEYGVGGGITWGSTTDGEYAEAFTKAAFLKTSNAPFELLETLKLENGEYALLPRHLHRLSSSAQFFGIPLDVDLVADNLNKHASQFVGMRRRVRLLVSQKGKIQVESTPLHELPNIIQTVALAHTPVVKADKFLYHKTTYREIYTQHQNDHPTAFDVLLWNEDGQLTEFTNGNAVFEIEERKVTPPRECGLLAGTFRAELLAQGLIEEAVLRKSDIEKVTRIWLINSVRGWVPVRIHR